MIDEGLFLPLYFHKRKKNNYGAQLVVPKSRAVVGFWFMVRFALLCFLRNPQLEKHY